MKRAIGIAATVLLTAGTGIPNPESTGTAPDYGGTGAVGSVSSGGVNRTRPVPPGYPAPSWGRGPTRSETTTLPLFTPGLLGITWDSGYQQCQVGNHKINYRFWLTRNPSVYNMLGWVVHYEVLAEDKNAIGRGWHQADQLAYIRGSFGHGGTPTVGYLALGHLGSAHGELASGTNPNGLTEVSIRVARYGGRSGLYVVWPGDGCHEG